MLPPQPQFSLPTPQYFTRQGSSPAVLAAQVRHGAAPVEGEVLHPLLHLLHGAAAEVAADVGLATQLLAEVEELVAAEVVVLGDAAPVGVDHGGAGPFGADAVHPVVLVGEAAAGPAQVGNPQRPQGLDHVVADAPGVGDRGVLPDPDAAVDAAAEVLGEVAVQVAADGVLAEVGVDDDSVHAVRVPHDRLNLTR